MTAKLDSIHDERSPIKPYRIFLGVNEIGGIILRYKKAFTKMGGNTFSVINKCNRFFFDEKYDVINIVKYKSLKQKYVLFRLIPLNIFIILQNIRNFIHAIQECDIFLYIFPTESLLPNYIDWFILKKLGKRIITILAGSDIRYILAQQQESELLGYGHEEELLWQSNYGENSFFMKKIQIVKAVEKYSDLIIAQPASAQLLSRPYMRFNIPIELDKLSNNIPGRIIPLILHAPTHLGYKGTSHILQAVQELKDEGLKFEFKLIENLSHSEMYKLLEDADIVIDQIFSQTVATLALESMASGCLVLARYLPERAKISNDCPVVNVNIFTIKEKLRKAIQDREWRIQLASQGRDFVQKNHDYFLVSKQILDWLQPGGIKEYDFTPTFFREHFRISPMTLRNEQKRLFLRYLKKIPKILIEQFED